MTRTRKSSKEALEDKILKAKEDVQNYKEKYEAACATLKELETKRDELEKFILNIFDQEPNKAIRRHGQLIAKYEKKYKVGTIVYNICTKITYIRYLLLHILNKK